MRTPMWTIIAGALALVSCKPDPVPTTPGGDDSAGTEWECVIPEGTEPDYSQQLGCQADFDALSSDPLDASIPGAKSVKTVIDRVDEDALYFQNSELYPIHWEFAFNNLSGDGLPYVSELATFNSTEYTSPDRRFILGAITYYEEPGVWAYELSPYDTASAEMIETAYMAIVDNAWFGPELYFHPTSVAIETEAENLSDDVKIITTDELFAGITYQPLNLGTSMGQLAFYEADELEEAAVNFREIVVLDAVPNDIGVVSGIITSEFQTPLSHINVLSQNRGTPNMALRDGFEDPTLTALDGLWVELTVEALDWSIREVTKEEADQWWEDNRPDPIEVEPLDTETKELILEEDIIDTSVDLADAIQARIPTCGGKATHYGGLAQIGDALPHPEAFCVPTYWYNKHMEDNGLWEVAEAMLEDAEFQESAQVRSEKLEELRDMIEEAEVDPELIEMLTTQIQDGYDSGLYPSTRFRFRSSTNAEDVSGFNGAGLYDSNTGDPNDDDRPIDEAVKETWASVWSYRAFDEREYYSINHLDIGMALLCHRGFPDEQANGVAVTGNIYDLAGLEPAFYVNVQLGEESVVFPEEGVTTDIYLHYWEQAGQPVVYLGHSSLVDEDETVLSHNQVYELGLALDALHDYFFEVYGGEGFYAMDVEFKFDTPEGADEPQVFVKQARPYPGWNAN